MKTDINTILKKGNNTKVKVIDYSTPKRKKELIELKKKADLVLKNKEVSWYEMSKIIINV